MSNTDSAAPTPLALEPRTLEWRTLELPRTLCAQGALAALPAELAALGVRRPMLVTDQGLVAAGLAAQVQAVCGGAPVLFDSVTENPLFADADRGAHLYALHACDGVIALGGGSVIDTAKFIAVLATNPGTVRLYAGVPGAPHGPAAPLIVLPTTAGTGSEASPSAAIHPDAATASVGMNSRHLVPRVAILDPVLTRSLPARLTAATGIDALSHCIEGFLSDQDQPLGKAIALDGIARVAAHVRNATADGDDMAARAQMLLAGYAGGVSIGMGLGPAHAIALTCSDQGYHHGVLSGIGLVATLDVTAAHAPLRAAQVAAAFGLAPGASLANAVAALMRELGLPSTLAELGYAVDAGADAVTGTVQRLAGAAQVSHFNRWAPFKPSVAQYAALIGASLAPVRPPDTAALCSRWIGLPDSVDLTCRSNLPIDTAPV